MGFSVSASTIIIFIGLVISAGVIYGAWDYSQDTLIEGEEIKNQLHIDKQQTDISIDENTINYDEDEEKLVFESKNEGNTNHDLKDTSIIIDGSITQEEDYQIEIIDNPGSEIWIPGDRVHIEVEDVEEEPDRIVLVADNGIKDICSDW